MKRASSSPSSNKEHEKNKTTKKRKSKKNQNQKKKKRQDNGIRAVRGVLIKHQKTQNYAEARNDFELVKKFEDFTGNRIDTGCMNMLISLCSGDLELTREVFEHSNVKNEYAYTALIKEVCSQEGFEDAYKERRRFTRV